MFSRSTGLIFEEVNGRTGPSREAARAEDDRTVIDNVETRSRAR
jgi:hypothetical protein